MKKPPLALLGFLFCAVAFAQQSTNYKLTEYTFNAGGHPEAGVVLTSTGYRVTLDAVGDSVTGGVLSSDLYRMDGGIVGSFPPPGEVVGLRFSDDQTLSWSDERSAGVYDLYRDDTSDGYGNCEQEDLPGPPATDASTPAVGSSYFYLVTVKNRLGEEGTKGFRSDETERLGGVDLPVCP